MVGTHIFSYSQIGPLNFSWISHILLSSQLFWSDDSVDVSLTRARADLASDQSTVPKTDRLHSLNRLVGLSAILIIKFLDIVRKIEKKTNLSSSR